MLITVGELDYRILASQGMQAFNAAKMHGLEAEMLVFPDENHWVLKPQNAILTSVLCQRKRLLITNLRLDPVLASTSILSALKV